MLNVCDLMIYSASRWRNLTPSPLTPAMRAVMEARSRRREQEEGDDNFEKSIKPLPENSKSPNSGNSNGGMGNGSSSKKRASPPLRASSSSPMKATSTPRRKLNFGNKGKSLLYWVHFSFV